MKTRSKNPSTGEYLFAFVAMMCAIILHILVSGEAESATEELMLDNAMEELMLDRGGDYVGTLYLSVEGIFDQGWPYWTVSPGAIEAWTKYHQIDEIRLGFPSSLGTVIFTIPGDPKDGPRIEIDGVRHILVKEGADG